MKLNLIRYFSLSLLIFGINTQLVAQGLQVGAQATTLSAKLDYTGGSEEYKLEPNRVEIAWHNGNTYYWGVHILTPGTARDVDPSGFTFEMEMDNSYGLFIGQNSGNGTESGYYAGFALQLFDTSYRLVPTTIQDEDDILMLGLFLGGEINIVSTLNLYVDGSYYFGTANYDTFFPNGSDIEVKGFAAGLRYIF